MKSAGWIFGYKKSACFWSEYLSILQFMQIEELQTLDLRKQTKVIKALAHPSRLLIVHALMDHEPCVCELRNLLGQDISTVSRHLSVLKNAGLVIEEKRGLYVYYKLTVPCLKNFLNCLNNMICESSEKERPSRSV
jgi:ArsR family transcriptional regulator